MYKILPIAGKGLGIFATQRIPRGTRILSEVPLLGLKHDQSSADIHSVFQELSNEKKKAVWELSKYVSRESRVIRSIQAFWAVSKGLVDGSTTRHGGNDEKVGMIGNEDDQIIDERPSFFSSINQHVAVTSIFRSNAFALGASAPFHQAVFSTISRLNHSCVPNCQGNFHPLLGKFNVHATRDIEASEEVTINYLVEHGALRGARMEKLKKDYGFDCDCAACGHGKVGVEGEKRRLEMKNLLESFAAGVEEGKDGTEDELRTVLAYIKLMNDEGLSGREVSTLYLEAARLYTLLGRNVEALRSAEQGLEIEKHVVGIDHPTYSDVARKVQDMRVTV